MTDNDINPELAVVHARTRQIYDREAEAYDRQRARVLFEKAWLDRFLASLPLDADSRPSILDVGCGGGEPIASYLIAQGAALTGVDMAPAMLAIARARFPDSQWIEADMRSLALGQRFAGIISWNAFFHLSRAEQRAAIPRLCAHVAPGGALLVTVGHQDGEVTGTVNGETVYHASLAPAEYDRVLRACGFKNILIVTEDASCDHHSIVLATGLGRQAIEAASQ